MTRNDGDERIKNALRLVGSDVKPSADWERKVIDRVAAGEATPRVSWLRRLWRRVTGGR